MPKWFPWVVGLLAVVFVAGYFISKDIQRKLDEAQATANTAKSAADTVDKYGNTINAIGSTWTSVSSFFK